jgi:tetratricopeptide (TPR) repeat protein
MNKVAKFAVAGAVALVLGTAVPALAADAPAASSGPKPQVSAAAGKDLQAAQKALTDQKYDEVLADLDKVKNNPKKNEYDDYVMNEFLVSAYAGQKKLEEAVVPLETIMASKYMPPDELKRRVQQATYLYYQLKNYDKAIEYGNRAIQAGDAPAQLQTAVAQAYYLKNDYKGTDKFVRGMVDDQVKAGQMPTEELLQLGLSSSLKQNDDAGEAHWLELLVAYHPKPEYWENVVQTLYHNKLNDKQLLQVYRLSADVGILKGSDYAEMAQLALDAGSPGEAVAILTKGFANNVFTEAADKNRNQHLLDSAKKQAATDQPTLPKSEADAATAAGGDRYVGVGIGYFGYGDYDKASKDIAAGLAKGTTKDSTDARLLLGIAQLKSGDKDGAVKTFQSVKGDPVAERVAALWILHAKSG